MSTQQCVECGAEATCERVIEGLVVHLCARHAAEVDRGEEEGGVMGIHILAGECETRSAACLVDSTSGTVFGPLFRSYEDADGFLAWTRAGAGPLLRTPLVEMGASDLRQLDDGDLTRLYTRWLAQPACCACLEERAVSNGRCLECGPNAEMAASPDMQEERP